MGVFILIYIILVFYKQLMDDGIDYLFISNADNLAATVDSAIVQHLDQNQMPIFN